MNYHCAKCYTNISTNMENTNIFPFLAIFSQNFDYFTPKMAIFGPIQLGIIAYTCIIIYIINHQYAKFHVFIKKFAIDVISHWL